MGRSWDALDSSCTTLFTAAEITEPQDTFFEGERLLDARSGGGVCVAVSAVALLLEVLRHESNHRALSARRGGADRLFDALDVQFRGRQVAFR